MIKKALLTLVAAGCLATISFTGTYAATPNTVSSQTEQVVQLKERHTLSKNEIQEIRNKTKKAENYQGLISMEMVKSPNYAFENIAGGDAYKSPIFYHSSGNILVTLVQWDDSWLTTADVHWILKNRYGTIIQSRQVKGEYTDETFSIDFGQIAAGDYSITVANYPENRPISGNFFIYY